MSVPHNRDYRFDVQLREGLAVEAWFYEMTSGGDRFEVKNDRRALETGRVYVEFEEDRGHTGRWTPCGIATSQADCWIFALGDPVSCFVGVSTARLRKLVEVAEVREQPYGSCPTRARVVPLRALLGLPPR